MARLNLIKYLMNRPPVLHMNEDRTVSNCIYIGWRDCLIYKLKYIGKITNNIFNVKYMTSNKPVFDRAYFFDLSKGERKAKLLEYTNDTEFTPNTQLRITYIDYKTEILRNIDKFTYYRTGIKLRDDEQNFIEDNYSELASIEDDRLKLNVYIDNNSKRRKQ